MAKALEAVVNSPRLQQIRIQDVQHLAVKHWLVLLTVRATGTLNEQDFPDEEDDRVHNIGLDTRE